jgi:excisionase family DNA binding protein
MGILTTNERLATDDLPRVSPDAGSLLTAQDVADLLKVPVSWVYEHTRSRGASRLPYIKLGKYLRFEERAIREFLERLRA